MRGICRPSPISRAWIWSPRGSSPSGRPTPHHPLPGRSADADTLKELDKPNGAAQIAHILLERCTHLYLFIGKAINPAHQNPQLPVDLSIKIRLLEDLAETLRGAGKVVQIKYY